MDSSRILRVYLTAAMSASLPSTHAALASSTAKSGTAEAKKP